MRMEPPGVDTMLRWTQCILAHSAMLVILIAGIAKGVDLSAFASSLSGWSIIPRWAAVPLGAVVVICELSSAGAWFFNLRRRLAAGVALALALALVFIFTGAVLLESTLAEAPNCHCFGEWLRFEIRQDTPQNLLIRNAILTVLLLWAYVYGKRP